MSGACRWQREYHIVTDIWTINLEGKLLLTQRHPDKTFGLWWECTGGSAKVGKAVWKAC